MRKIKTYSELLTFETFEERFRYLAIGGKIGEETFGFDRYLNQRLYRSSKWRKTRRDVILRDQACDLAIPGRDILTRIYVHHINEITVYDILEESPFVFDPEYLICTSKRTHDAIHFSDESILQEWTERLPNDTVPWRKEGL